METLPVKKPWQSKTVYVSLIVALASFVPGVGEYIKEHLELVGMVLGAIFAGLRLISKGKISIE